MKNNLIKTLLLSIIIAILVSCYPLNRTINYSLINNTEKLIYYGYSFSYPDISLKGITEFVPTKNSAYKVIPGQRQSQTLGNFSRNTTLQIFIFDPNVIENEPWDTIVKYNKFLKRYQFTRAELDRMNLEIIYDGN